MKGEKKLSSDKKKRSRKKRGAGRVRDRLKFDIDTSELYPLSRREEASFYDDDAPKLTDEQYKDFEKKLNSNARYSK